MRFLKDKLKLRLYQQTILDSALNKNTLCVLPTGLGKTFIAIGLAGLMLKEGKKILVLAPTKPLVNQHLKTFSEFFEFESGEVVAFSGEVPPKKRAALWKGAKIVFSTPQTIKFDILAKRIELEEVSLLVFDEAHRAVGNYSYVFIAKEFAKHGGRILALTASPGADETKIREICNNLFIQKIEARDKKHWEVRPFVKPLLINYVFVELPQEMKTIKKHLELAMRDRLVILKRLGFVESIDLSKYAKRDFLALQANLRGRVSEGNFEIMRGLSVAASLLKIYHAINLLESESLIALNTYFKELWEKANSTKIRAVKDIVQDFHIRVAYKLTQEAIEKGVEHPKLEKLKEIVSKTLGENPNAKILIFTEFRSNIPQIINVLSKFRVEKFVGQAAATDKGMSQKEQIKIIEKLKSGEINILVCTSVAEEGLDIPSVDLVVFYAPVPSAIRSIQRKGRTGRQKIGKIVLLLAKGTKDLAYYWVSKHKERRMASTIKKLSGKTLEPELSKFVKTENPEIIKIYVDTRERGGIVERLHELGAKLEIKSLEMGDFVLSEAVVVEKKNVEDFAASLIDQRLFRQALEMKRNFEKPLFIIEGNLEELFTSRNIDPRALRAAIISLALDYGIPFIFSSSPEETAEYLYAIAKREQLELKKEVSLRGSRRNWTLAEQQQFLIEGLPMVGPNLARALLKAFKSPKKIANASIEELKKVEKIGDKKAEIIRRIFDEEYSES